MSPPIEPDMVSPPVDEAGSDWWLWFIYSFMIFAFIFVLLIILFDDPEVRSYSRQQARRLSEWYHEGSGREIQNELTILSNPSHQAGNPPLYQTIVPPTYHYQKPPTPVDPPPKYEALPSNSTETPTRLRSHPQDGDLDKESTDEVRCDGTRLDREALSPSQSGQPDYERKGKTKSKKHSSLLKEIRNMGGHKLVTRGHDIFIRKSDTLAEDSGDTKLSSDVEDDGEVIFELRTQPLNSLAVQ